MELSPREQVCLAKPRLSSLVSTILDDFSKIGKKSENFRRKVARPQLITYLSKAPPTRGVLNPYFKHHFKHPRPILNTYFKHHFKHDFKHPPVFFNINYSRFLHIIRRLLLPYTWKWLPAKGVASYVTVR